MIVAVCRHFVSGIPTRFSSNEGAYRNEGGVFFKGINHDSRHKPLMFDRQRSFSFPEGSLRFGWSNRVSARIKADSLAILSGLRSAYRILKKEKKP